MLRVLWTVLRGRRTLSSELLLAIRRNRPLGRCFPLYLYRIITDLMVLFAATPNMTLELPVRSSIRAPELLFFVVHLSA